MQATLDALRRHPGLPQERRVGMLGDAAAEQRRMVDLLDGLQALARGDAHGAARAEVDLTELVDSIVVAVAARHPDRDIDAELPDAPVLVRGWEPGLRSLVENLVRNAVVHGGGRVRVTLEEGPALHVDDDGPGVADGDRERIFEPFARLDGATRPGSGLGLALVEQQARHHGATVKVTKSPLGGARFSVGF